VNELWQSTLDALRARVGEKTFETWFSRLRLHEAGPDKLEVLVPNRFFKEWFENNYLEEVQKTVCEIAARDYQVELAVDETPETPRPREPEPEPEPALPAQAGPATPPKLHPRYRFDSFIKGSSNELAASAALAVADDPGQRFNPLFIYGGVGLGKTHLLQAVGHSLHERNPNMRIVYMSAERFMNDFVTAVRNNAFDAFRARYRDDCDCLLVDDIQFIAGRDRTMDEFFHVFNSLYESGKQIVISADRVPGDMVGMEARLTSRLNWGLVADVQTPDLETRIAIVEQKAERDGVPVDRETARTIAELMDSNVRDLEGALVRVSAYADLRGRKLDAAFVREALGVKKKKVPTVVTVEAVQKAVAGHFRVRVAELKGRRRHQAIARPRMIAMYLSRELSGASFPEIGLRFGGRDHSTVISACRRIESISREDEGISAAVDALRERLLGHA
jgi:chromosomal replication initiator protein